MVQADFQLPAADVDTCLQVAKEARSVDSVPKTGPAALPVSQHVDAEIDAELRAGEAIKGFLSPQNAFVLDYNLQCLKKRGMSPDMRQWPPSVSAFSIIVEQTQGPVARATDLRQWTSHHCSDAFAGQNAYNMPSSDIAAVKRECDRRGFTAFTIFKDTAYLRSQSAAQCRQAMTHMPKGATLYLKELPTVAPAEAAAKAKAERIAA